MNNPINPPSSPNSVSPSIRREISRAVAAHPFFQTRTVLVDRALNLPTYTTAGFVASAKRRGKKVFKVDESVFDIDGFSMTYLLVEKAKKDGLDGYNFTYRHTGKKRWFSKSSRIVKKFEHFQSLMNLSEINKK